MSIYIAPGKADEKPAHAILDGSQYMIPNPLQIYISHGQRWSLTKVSPSLPARQR